MLLSFDQMVLLSGDICYIVGCTQNGGFFKRVFWLSTMALLWGYPCKKFGVQSGPPPVISRVVTPVTLLI